MIETVTGIRKLLSADFLDYMDDGLEIHIQKVTINNNFIEKYDNILLRSSKLRKPGRSAESWVNIIKKEMDITVTLLRTDNSYSYYRKHYFLFENEDDKLLVQLKYS